MKTDRQTDVG